MIEPKHKPRVWLLAVAGFVVMIVAILSYYFEEPFLIYSADKTRLLMGSSGLFGFGLAMLSLTLHFSVLEAKIKRLEDKLEPKIEKNTCN
jgi:hypothetical protein